LEPSSKMYGITLFLVVCGLGIRNFEHFNSSQGLSDLVSHNGPWHLQEQRLIQIHEAMHVASAVYELKHRTCDESSTQHSKCSLVWLCENNRGLCGSDSIDVFYETSQNEPARSSFKVKEWMARDGPSVEGVFAFVFGSALDITVAVAGSTDMDDWTKNAISAIHSVDTAELFTNQSDGHQILNTVVNLTHWSLSNYWPEVLEYIPGHSRSNVSQRQQMVDTANGGFVIHLLAMYPRLVNTIRRKFQNLTMLSDAPILGKGSIRIVGHSLGGAVSAILLNALLKQDRVDGSACTSIPINDIVGSEKNYGTEINLYTFGSPRPWAFRGGTGGSPLLMRMGAMECPSHDLLSRHFRWVNKGDPVPYVPAGGSHSNPAYHMIQKEDDSFAYEVLGGG